MTDTTARLGLPLIQPSQAQKHVTHNEALALLDGITQLVIQEQGAVTPPASPGVGDVYALGASPTDAWAGEGDTLAKWNGSFWQFIAPQEGWLAWDLQVSKLLAYHSGSWQATAGSFSELGINTSADATNRLAVASEASLLTHDGAGHQLKINKAGVSDTASLLYQSNFGGRAEMGLTGNDNFHLKVSPDGTNWVDSLIVDGANGQITGAAVQSQADDATAGRMMAVGAFGLGETGQPPEPDDLDNPALASGFYSVASATVPGTYPDGVTDGELVVRRVTGSWTSQDFTYRGDVGGVTYTRSYNVTASAWTPWARVFDQGTIVGTVTQTGGAPTGAVIERGLTVHGEYVRFADGTQICSNTVMLGDPTSEGSGTFADPYACPVGGAGLVFPREFAAPPVLNVSHYVDGGGPTTASRAFTPTYTSVVTWGFFGYRAVRLTSDASTNGVTMVYTAIGRWF
ncbi:MAG: DUF2793 domain-containing protein [Pseudomonadota bacterium]